MSNAGKNKFKRCPKCKKQAIWETLRRCWKCQDCQIYFNDDGEQTTSESPDAKHYTNDTVKLRHLDGNEEQVLIEYRVYAEDEPPNLHLDPKRLAFHKHRLRRLIAREKRWGRDYQREQKDDPLPSSPVLVDACWAVRTALRRKPSITRTYTREELDEYVAETNEFLAQLKGKNETHDSDKQGGNH